MTSSGKVILTVEVGIFIEVQSYVKTFFWFGMGIMPSHYLLGYWVDEWVNGMTP